MQIIRWIILLFVTVNCLSETCRAYSSDKAYLSSRTAVTSINQADDILASLISFLHFQSGDLTEETTHSCWDKKNFFKLLVHSGHNRIPSPEQDPLHTFIPRQTVLTGPVHTGYYIYWLKKIVV